ncbi:MAG TPA: GNAT family N-acetyltransferase [Gemmatimonadaceae bacterium]
MTGPPSRTRQFITTPLESHHDRAAFSCGEASLDNYLRDRAVPDAKGLSTITFVLLDPADQRTIQGYYSLSSTSIEFGAVPDDIVKRLRISRHRTMSATLIGRLAVSTRCQGRRLGEALLFDALTRSYFAAREVGSALIIVRALDDDAERFYRKYGFIPLVDVQRGLFIPTATVAPLMHHSA